MADTVPSRFEQAIRTINDKIRALFAEDTGENRAERYEVLLADFDAAVRAAKADEDDGGDVPLAA